jgi:hypothetical protein
MGIVNDLGMDNVNGLWPAIAIGNFLSVSADASNSPIVEK